MNIRPLLADKAGMRNELLEREAGDFARRRFNRRRRAWRRRFFWAFPIVLVGPIAISLPIALIAGGSKGAFLVGLTVGAGAGATMVLFDSPPAYIENWRVGADGERATARQLRGLCRRGWTLFNDVDTGRGNIDHVLVGPPGVFLLETKRLSGRVRVERGTLAVRWHEDPDDGYSNDRIAARVRAVAADLRSRLSAAGVNDWIQGVVVLWADFEQDSVMSGKVAWIRGGILSQRLEAQEVEYSTDALVQLSAAVRSALEEIAQAGHTERRDQAEVSREPKSKTQVLGSQRAADERAGLDN